MPSFVLQTLSAAIQRQQEDTVQHQVHEESLPPPDQVAALQSSLDDTDDIPIDPALLEPSRRRPRSNSTSTPAQRKAKHARFTDKSCDFYHLRGAMRLKVQDFSGLTTTEQMIVLFASTQSIRQDLAARTAESFTITSEFKDRSQLMLRVLLLAPTNKSYVAKDVKRFLKSDLRNHFSDWKVPRSTVDHTDSLKELLKNFARKLTAERNSIKETNEYCINQLMNELAPEDVYVTDRHRARWAWILGYYREHSKDTSKKSITFWTDLDAALVELEGELKERAQDVAQRNSARNNSFEQALFDYRRSYPTKESPRRTPKDAADWQIALETRLARTHNYAAII